MKHMRVSIPHDTRAVAHPGRDLHRVMALGDQAAHARVAAVIWHRSNAKLAKDLDAPDARGPIVPDGQEFRLRHTVGRDARAHVPFPTLGQVRAQIVKDRDGACAVGLGAGDFATLGRHSHNNCVVFYVVPPQRNGFRRPQAAVDHQREQAHVTRLRRQDLKDACHIGVTDHGALGWVNAQLSDTVARIHGQDAFFYRRAKTGAQNAPNRIDGFGGAAIAQHVSAEVLQHGPGDLIHVVAAKPRRNVALQHVGAVLEGAGLPAHAVDGDPARGPLDEAQARRRGHRVDDGALHVGPEMLGLFLGGERLAALLAMLAPHDAPRVLQPVDLLDGCHAASLPQVAQNVAHSVAHWPFWGQKAEASNDETPLTERGFKGSGRRDSNSRHPAWEAIFGPPDASAQYRTNPHEKRDFSDSDDDPDIAKSGRFGSQCCTLCCTLGVAA